MQKIDFIRIFTDYSIALSVKEQSSRSLDPSSLISANQKLEEARGKVFDAIDTLFDKKGKI